MRVITFASFKGWRRQEHSGYGDVLRAAIGREARSP